MNQQLIDCPPGVQITGELKEGYAEILTTEALEFVAALHRTFLSRRTQLLQLRDKKYEEIQAGKLPDFLPETEHIRKGRWTVAPVPKDLEDRRVEITGPAGDRKMVINAFNSGANSFMADFEDANSPTWDNTIGGQINLRDAIRKTISFVNDSGKKYELKDEVATLLVRARGWHLVEKHIIVDDEPISASMLDFGLFMFHNAQYLINHGSGPYFYLPKLETHLEARLWNDIFIMAQKKLNVPQGTIKATVLIETILATFEMDEILYELRDHSAGLNCGRWDYIFSYIKKLRNHEQYILPDRALVTMTVPFMRAYTLHTIKTCHKRNAFAMGGMAAQIPVKSDPIKNEDAMEKVRLDKEREARDGHDGSWVAHPGLVPVAKQAFDQYMSTPNQLHKKREDVQVTASELLAVPEGEITEQGLRMNISIGIQYTEAWLRGYGAVPLFHLMEDAATAEISRAQVWQWIRHPKGILSDGRNVSLELVHQFIEEELDKVQQFYGMEKYKAGKFDIAKKLFIQLIENDQFEEFLTLPGYEYLH
ncbi:malate synthase A [Longirhabdus pacifica]|uniref:malate synthase A n=1 Tax=Longirhabdus pacifica TaxID=2305227 RepID=UPI001008C139|nr:malate synthase A [Longirhabdus pacifica]